MKSSTKSSLRNILVSIVLIGSAAVFGRLFWNELTRTVENVGGTVVGEVVEVRGQAQRRYDRQSRWGSLKGDEPIYNLDAIRTSEDSGAVIVLKTLDEAGTERFDEIALGPDTYIILDLIGQGRNINFVGGDISASGGEGLTVMAEGTEVAVDGGSVSLSRQEGRETSVSVTEGEARVRTGGESTVLGVDTVLRIDESSGSAVREEATVNPLKPRSNSLLLTFGETRQVDFSWDLFADWSRPALEVSSDPDFDGNGDSILRIEADSQASMDLPPGVWYWRVADAAGTGAGPVGVFTVDIERESSPTSPAAGLAIPFRSAAPAVSLQWNRAWFADSYTVELSRSASFSEIVTSRDVTGSSVLAGDLSAGTWWWRVIPNYRRAALDEPPTVEPRSFVLERRTGHDPLVLVYPQNGASLSALEIRDGVDFRWEGRDELVEYRIEVSTDAGFTDTAAVSEAPENWRKLLTAPEPGTYWWRVGATSSDGQPVPDSEIRSFEVRPISGTVELLDPAPGETRELVPYAPYDFVWQSAIPGTARFQLHRIDGASGERMRIIESLVNGESFTAPLPGEGRYAWKIQILDDSGRTLVESPEAVFRLRSEFRPPELNSPAPGTGIDLVGSPSIVLGWNPAPGADAYTAVLRGPDGLVIGRDDRIVGLDREFALPSGAGIGEYTVELGSMRDNPPSGASRSSETAVYRFTVDRLLRYTAAVPVSPGDGRVIGALDALRDGVLLTWRQDPPLGRWTVEIDNGSVTRLYRTTEPRLRLDGLDSGRYSWVVRSADGLGQQAPDSRTATFSVSALPDLAAPTVTEPAAGGNIDMTGQDRLVFAWEPVPEAEFYDLTLYAGGSEVPVLRETGLTGSPYVLRNLRILDVGDFELRIRARSEFEDVGVTRKSTERRVPFSLSLNIASDAPTILTDEVQYAE